jgi:uncharacterized protein
MRSPEDLAADHQPRRRRRRIVLIVAVLAIVLLLGSLRSLAGLWTDSMWFSSIDQHQVFTTLLGVKIGLLLVFGVLFAVGLWVNLHIVDRIARTASITDPDDEMVRRYQDAVRPYTGRLYLGLAIILGIGAGSSAIGQWQNYLLFSHAKSFGTKDPQFGLDVGFYVFRLPFLQFLVSWFTVVLVLMTIATGIFHYLNGGIRGQRVSPRVRPPVKVHLSVLVALLAIVKALGYLLERYALTTSTNGYVEGATYTDVHARLPAMSLLFWISLLCAAILLFNIWRQGWTLPVLAIGLWAFVALIIGVLFPALLQTLKVTPAQSSLERPYISRNITATRAAYAVNNVASHPFNGSEVPTQAELTANAATLANIRLWDPDPQISLQTFQKLQGLRPYYIFPSLGVDRYTVNGKVTPTLSGVRQLNTSGLPAQSWVNDHLEYTHGTGMAIAEANQVLPNGNPIFDVGNVPPVSSGGLPSIAQAGVFFGLNNPGWVVANTKQPELDYQTPSGIDITNHYTGDGGVKINGFFRRAAFALRLSDFNLLISNLITNNSRIMFVRDVGAMANKAAPFLSFDHNPYSVLINGQINWVLDGYTTTDRYPYSQNAGNLQVPPGSGLPASYNYVRNSVKVVVNAYSGKMTLYVTDPSDPVIKAWESVFPNLFTPMSKMTTQLRSHLRYPEDIFAAQVATYGRYHITNPASFYNAGDAWSISQTSGAGSPSQTLAISQTVNAQGFVVTSSAQRMAPIYQVNSLPGTTAQTFTISEAYVPKSNSLHIQNLTGFMIATSDPNNYGKLSVYVTPSGQNTIGPVMADSEIQQNTKVSSIITPLDQHGSSVLLGNTLMIPINQSMLYIRPLYVTSSSNSLPQLKYVIAVFNSHVDIETSLSAALSTVLAADVSVPSGGSSGTSGTSSGKVPSAITALLDQATASYQAAQTALKAGDLAGYQSNIQAMYAALLQAQALAQSSTGSSSKSTTTTTAPASTTRPLGSALTTTTTTTKAKAKAKSTSAKSAATQSARRASGT